MLDKLKNVINGLTVELPGGGKIEAKPIEVAMVLASALGLGWMYKKGINNLLSKGTDNKDDDHK